MAGDINDLTPEKLKEGMLANARKQYQEYLEHCRETGIVPSESLERFEAAVLTIDFPATVEKFREWVHTRIAQLNRA